MGQTLTNGIYLPNEGERNCYSGLAANWNAVDTLKGNYSLHANFKGKLFITRDKC